MWPLNNQISKSPRHFQKYCLNCIWSCHFTYKNWGRGGPSVNFGKSWWKTVTCSNPRHFKSSHILQWSCHFATVHFGGNGIPRQIFEKHIQEKCNIAVIFFLNRSYELNWNKKWLEYFHPIPLTPNPPPPNFEKLETLLISKSIKFLGKYKRWLTGQTIVYGEF